MQLWISEKSIHFRIARKRDIEEMIEAIKAILIAIGFFSGYVYVFVAFNRLCDKYQRLEKKWL